MRRCTLRLWLADPGRRMGKTNVRSDSTPGWEETFRVVIALRLRLSPVHPCLKTSLVSRVRILVPLKTRHAKWLVYVKCVEAENLPVDEDTPFVCATAKEGRNDDQLCPTITLADANAVANYRLLPHRYKKTFIVDFDCSRNLTSIIARLRTGHFKGMKISSDKTRTYIPCKNCTEAQLTPDHILECPALTPHIIRLGMVPLASELREVLYSANAPRLAEAVQRAHDII
ncbi:hypothetical protein TNCV_4933651 [Trichonephila clavipes]|nr:hypothetical protein TNCV_4933651 [Trichonephila clavipes]